MPESEDGGMNSVKVEIYGSEYRIRGDTDAESIQEIAHYVDSKMGEVSDATKETSLAKLSNTAKMLNILLEQINPMIVTTEEGESLIDGQI